MPKTLIVVVVVWLLAATGAITAAIASSDSGRATSQVAVTGQLRGTVELTGEGVPPEHIERHAAMTEQMRVATPDARMRAVMAADPMWQMMRSPAHTRAEEARQEQIDRMLARIP